MLLQSIVHFLPPYFYNPWPKKAKTEKCFPTYVIRDEASPGYWTRVKYSKSRLPCKFNYPDHILKYFIFESNKLNQTDKFETNFRAKYINRKVFSDDEK